MRIDQTRAKALWALAALLALALAACDGDDPGDGGDDGGGPGQPAGLELSLSVEGYGQVVSSPRRQDCFGVCSLRFDTAPASLLAVPGREFRFAGWGGACAALSGPVCTLEGSGALPASARFEPAPLDLSTAIWRDGDLHTHSDHSSDGSLWRQTFDDAAPGNMPLGDILRLVEGMQLDFLPITDHRSHDQHYDPEWESDSVLLITGEEANGSPHATAHGGVDMIDQNASVEGAPDSRVVQESVWLAHSQGAAWVTAHPDDGEMNDDGTLNARADAVGIDLVETWNRASDIEREIDYAENRWNAGFRFGIAGASDDHFKELWLLGGTPARPATQVLVPELSERALLDALRAGRTQLYSRDVAGPKLRLDGDFDGDGVYEVQAGQEVLVPAGTAGRLRLRVEGGLGSRAILYAAPGRSAEPLLNWVPTGLGGGEQVVEIETGADPGWYRAELRSLGLAEPSSLLFGLLLGPYSLENLLQELLAQLRAATSPIFVSEAAAEPQGEFLPPPDQGLDDGAEYAFGAPGEFAGFVDAAYEPASAQLHLVAESHEPLATRVEYSRRDGDGRWQAPRQLADSASARFPRVAAAGPQLAVVWQDERAGQRPRRPAIYLRRSSDGGLSFGPEILVRALDGRAMHPDVAIDAEGRTHVVWQEIRRGEPYDIGYATVAADATVSPALNLSRAGKSFHAASALDARSALYPASVRPAIALDGAVPVVAWQDNRQDLDPLWTGQASYGEGSDPDDWQIAVLRLDGEGDEPVYLGAADAADRHPDLGVDAAGRIHVAWDSKPLRSAGANLRLLASWRAAGSGEFSAPQAVAEQPASSARQPRLGLDAEGRAQLAWFDSRSSDWRWRLMSAAFDESRDQSQWSEASLWLSRGLSSWPVPAGPYLAFASTRHARRLQRDRSQQVYVLDRGAESSQAVRQASKALATKALRLSTAPLPATTDCAHEWQHRARSLAPPWKQ